MYQNTYFLSLLVEIVSIFLLSLAAQLTVGNFYRLYFAQSLVFPVTIYGYVLWSKLFGLSFWAMIFGFLIAILVSFIIFTTTLNLNHNELVLACLAFMALGKDWVSSMQILGLSSGLLVKPVFYENPLIFTFWIVTLGLTIFLLFHFSKFDLQSKASGDNPLLTKFNQISYAKLFLVSLILSSVLVSLVAFNTSFLVGFIDPSQFSPWYYLAPLTVVFVSGLRTVWANFVAVILYEFMIEMPRFLDISFTLIGPIRNITTSILLIICLLFLQKGLFGRIRFRV